MIKIIFYSAKEELRNIFEAKYLEKQTFGSELKELGGELSFVNAIDYDIKKIFQQKELNPSENQIIFLSSSGDYLAHRSKPEPQYNWLDISKTFLVNYNNDQTDENGCYRWGQKIPETTEYLCIDCGYIESFEKGQVFPICEVCLSGDPATEPNYSGPAQGYWEKV